MFFWMLLSHIRIFALRCGHFVLAFMYSKMKFVSDFVLHAMTQPSLLSFWTMIIFSISLRSSQKIAGVPSNVWNSLIVKVRSTGSPVSERARSRKSKSWSLRVLSATMTLNALRIRHCKSFRTLRCFSLSVVLVYRY